MDGPDEQGERGGVMGVAIVGDFARVGERVMARSVQTIFLQDDIALPGIRCVGLGPHRTHRNDRGRGPEQDRLDLICGKDLIRFATSRLSHHHPCAQLFLLHSLLPSVSHLISLETGTEPPKAWHQSSGI